MVEYRVHDDRDDSTLFEGSRMECLLYMQDYVFDEDSAHIWLEKIKVSVEDDITKEELKPCPFCGQEIKIGISDDEGNFRDEGYESDPWSGLSYTLVHEYENGVECPIATHHGEILGSRLYESREEVTNAWNDRQC